MSDRTARLWAIAAMLAALALAGLTNTDDPASPEYNQPLDSTSSTP